MRKKLLAVLLCFALLIGVWGSVVPECVRAQQMINVNILVAYDQTMASGSYAVLSPFPGGPIPVTMKQYLNYQMERVNYRFNKIGVNLTVVEYVNWTSNDKYHTCSQLEDEAVSETGFNNGMYLSNGDFISGMYVATNGIVRVQILVAWTAQNTNDSYVGITGGEACLVRHEEFWDDDNILQHELSHAFGVPDEYNCSQPSVMDQDVVFYGSFMYAEDLTPMYNGGTLPQVAYIALAGWYPVTYLNDGWCNNDKITIEATAQALVDSRDPSYTLYPGPVAPVQPIVLRILMFMLIVAIIVLLVVLLDRFLTWRNKKTLERNAKLPSFSVI